MAFYFELFWLPAAVTAGLLVLLGASGGAETRTLFIYVTWFLLALALQFLAATTGTWIVGLVLQTTLAIVLVVRQQLERL